jgi:hypothetical protein
MADPAPSIDFDVAGAREAGFSDAAIADYLAGKSGFDIGGARKSGFANADIIAHLAPPPAPKESPKPAAAPPAEPESGTLKGIGKAAGQSAMEFAGGQVTGAGSILEAAGNLPQADTKRQIDVARQIDAGATMRDFKDLPDTDRLFAREYQVSDPDRRRQVYQGLINQMTPLERPIAEATKRVGQEVTGAGHAIDESAQRTFPLSEEEQGRFSVRTAKIMTGLAGYVGTAALTGMGGMVTLAGNEAFGKTYEEAKKKGATDEDAAKAAFINGTVQGGMNVIPMHRAMAAMDAIPQAFRGKFIEAATEMVKSSATLLAFSQFAQLADNVIAQSTFDPQRDLKQGLGEHMGETAVAGALVPVVGAAGRGVANRFRPKPEEIAKPVMEAGTVDEAIAAAKSTIERPTPIDVDVEAAQLREYGGQTEQRQAGLINLFGSLGHGTVEQAQDGSYHYRTGERTTPLKVWEPGASEQAGSDFAALVAAQREHYDQLGIKLVYFEDHPGIPFDGAVDPRQPNTIFLSNNPERNAAQVGAHEVTHILESTTTPRWHVPGRRAAPAGHEGLTPRGGTMPADVRQDRAATLGLRPGRGGRCRARRCDAPAPGPRARRRHRGRGAQVPDLPAARGRRGAGALRRERRQGHPDQADRRRSAGHADPARLLRRRQRVRPGANRVAEVGHEPRPDPRHAGAHVRRALRRAAAATGRPASRQAGSREGRGACKACRGSAHPCVCRRDTRANVQRRSSGSGREACGRSVPQRKRAPVPSTRGREAAG